MKKPRDLRKLLIRLRLFIKRDKKFDGLCPSINHLWAKEITTDEEDELLVNFMNENEPNYKYTYNDLYWRKSGNKAPRIRFLTKHIDKLKTKS